MLTLSGGGLGIYQLPNVKKWLGDIRGPENMPRLIILCQKEIDEIFH